MCETDRHPRLLFPRDSAITSPQQADRHLEFGSNAICVLRPPHAIYGERQKANNNEHRPGAHSVFVPTVGVARTHIITACALEQSAERKEGELQFR